MKIICIGRNYADHARELGNQVPSEPVVFLKPQSAILSHKHPFYIPEWTQEVHHEVELVVKIDRLGKTISEAHAPRYYSEVSLGLDLTARDVQSQLKAKGHPWERAKAFDGSAVIGQFMSLAQLGKDVQDLSFTLTNHGNILQEGQTQDMLFSVNRLIAGVEIHDVESRRPLFTGTPAGVAAVQSGDRLVGSLEGHDLFAVNVK